MAFLLATIFTLLITTSLSVPPTPKVEDYRLPTWYKPSSYDVQLNLPAEVFTATSNVFSGSVTIVFSVTSVTASIALHAQHDFITITTITVAGSGVETVTGNATVVLTNIPVTGYSTNNVTDILTITLGSNLVPDVVYALVIDYSSKLSTSDMYGLYKSSYVDGSGVTKYLVTTQFAATFARRAFPCFDEPALKATFDLTVTAPTGLNVLANTQEITRSINVVNGLTTVTFNTTSRMSTYLLALVVSDFTCTSGVLVGIVPTQVCSRNQSTNTREVAVEYGPKLLGSLNNFTNYEYSRGIEKLDQVAIPDFAAGAMENWGLVTYRETALLWDPNESSNRYKQRVVTVVAHELSHQWFGNLVTCRWWSEIFLNEGFATYFEYHIAHEVIPSWELNKQFVLEELHTALLSDALINAQSLQMDCSTPAEIIGRFGIISYNKGGSILRMVQHFMQLENFRAGLQNYLFTYEYNNTVPDDLWKVLNSSVPVASKLPSDLLTVMYNWITLPGYPLLSVNLRGNTVTISQRRFLLSGSDTMTEWYVPISYTTSVTPSKFESTTPDVWLAPDEDVSIILPQDANWIILNNQQTGYYRVNYDDALWYRIRSGLLKENFDGISELNRAQIVDDLFNLARADHLSYSFIFDILRFLYNDVSYYTWHPAFTGYNYLLRRVGEDSELGILIAGKVLELMSTLYRSVPLTTLKEDDQIYTLNQVQAHSWACRLGGNNCVNEIKNQFSEYRSTGLRPNRNIRSVVYCYALRYSNDSSDWNFLWDAYVNSTDLATEQITILSSLGCTTDVPLLTGYLQKSITDGSGIRPQDALSVFTSVYASSSVGVDVAFDFLIQNQAAIAEKYQSMNSLGNLIKGIAERFTKQTQVDRLKDFIDTGNLSDDFKLAANEALETAEANLKWREKYEGDLFVYYSSGVKVDSSLLAMAVAVICILLAQ